MACVSVSLDILGRRRALFPERKTWSLVLLSHTSMMLCFRLCCEQWSNWINLVGLKEGKPSYLNAGTYSKRALKFDFVSGLVEAVYLRPAQSSKRLLARRTCIHVSLADLVQTFLSKHKSPYYPQNWKRACFCVALAHYLTSRKLLNLYEDRC